MSAELVELFGEPEGFEPWELVWKHYLAYHPRAKLDLRGKRRKLILDRLAEGWSPEELQAAIDGNHRDPHCNGRNDRGTEYHSLELILRDTAHVERYIDVPAEQLAAARRTASRSRGLSAVEIALRGRRTNDAESRRVQPDRPAPLGLPRG